MGKEQIKEIIFYYCDRSIAAGVGKFNDHSKWEIYTPTAIGMGKIEFNVKKYNEEFDCLIPYCSFDSPAYIGVNKDGLWGLIRISTSNPDSIEGNWEFIEAIKYKTITELEAKYHLPPIYDTDKKESYIVVREIWSKETIQYTKDNLNDLTFGISHDRKVHMKNLDGRFGYIPLDGALDHKYTVINIEDGDDVQSFYDIDDMIFYGWVLD